VTDAERFTDLSLEPAVRGFVHRPEQASGEGVVLTHGAGGNSDAPLLRAMAAALAGAGFTVLRCDLPFRQARAFGPPRPGDAARDREGLGQALRVLRNRLTGRMFLGGHSYGGRQASMLAASEPELVDGLLLFSYPLHPPRNPDQLRTQHFPKLQTKALFVHGSRDGFGSLEELQSALRLIPARTVLLAAQGAGHDLGFGRAKRSSSDLPHRVLAEFKELFG
jgi:predicted alpha/beta-hydrolase family hydrolase